eukprot:6394445-Prymnesium_polylepis.1
MPGALMEARRLSSRVPIVTARSSLTAPHRTRRRRAHQCDTTSPGLHAAISHCECIWLRARPLAASSPPLS